MREGRRQLDAAAGIAFLGYLLVSFLLFGLHVAGRARSAHIGGEATDPQIFIWSFAWWPHALAAGEDPFVTHAIWAPDGFDLAWATSVPALALAFAPLTVVAGPILAYNAACVLAPALAALAAFLLCRHLTGRLWPSLAGGYLFGFSSYVLGGQLSHVNTVACFLVPLAALLPLRFLAGELGGRGLALAMGLLLALQAYLWTELLFTLTLALVCALALGLLLVPAARPRIARMLPPLVGAYLLAGALAAPLLYHVLTGLELRPPREHTRTFVADLANYAVPTRVSLGGWWTEGIAARFPAPDIERGAYLGLPALAIVAWFALRRARTPGGRFLLAALALAVVAALGSWLTVAGHRVTTMPWIHLAHLPLFEHVMTIRLSVYSSLAAAVIVALWASSRDVPRVARAILPALAVVAILPNPTLDVWARTPEVPELFRTGAYERCLRPRENVLAIPVGPRGDSLLWQVEADFSFRLAGGYISPRVPPSFRRPPSVVPLTTADRPEDVDAAAVLELARRKGVTTLVVAEGHERAWRHVLRRLGRPQRAGGALLYRLPPGSPPRPGCEAQTSPPR